MVVFFYTFGVATFVFGVATVVSGSSPVLSPLSLPLLLPSLPLLSTIYWVSSSDVTVVSVYLVVSVSLETIVFSGTVMLGVATVVVVSGTTVVVFWF